MLTSPKKIKLISPKTKILSYKTTNPITTEIHKLNLYQNQIYLCPNPQSNKLKIHHQSTTLSTQPNQQNPNYS